MYQKKQGWLLQCNTGTKAKNITFLTLCMNHTIMMSAKKWQIFSSSRPPWVLKILLAIMSDAYLEHSQKFMMKDFCENS